MAKGVVYALEMIHVSDHHGKPLAGVLGVLGKPRQLSQRVPAVVQSGQRVKYRFAQLSVDATPIQIRLTFAPQQAGQPQRQLLYFKTVGHQVVGTQIKNIRTDQFVGNALDDQNTAVPRHGVGADRRYHAQLRRYVFVVA